MSFSHLINRNIGTTRARSSMRLEPEVWGALKEICSAENITVYDLVSRAETNYVGGRTSAVRVYILEHYRSAAYKSA